MKNTLLRLNPFFKCHIDKGLLFISIFCLVNTFLYYFVFLKYTGIFDGAHELGIIFNAISISIVSSYMFYLFIFEIPGFKDKIKVFISFVHRKNKLQHAVEGLLQRFKIDEQSWIKLDYNQKNKLIQTFLEQENRSIKSIVLNESFEISQDVKNEIIKNEIRLITNEFGQIQSEFNNLTLHSRYLSSRLIFIIITIQEYKLFEMISMFHDLYSKIEVEKWDYDIFIIEYTTILDNLVKFGQVLAKEIDPYWDLIKDKTIDDFLK